MKIGHLLGMAHCVHFACCMNGSGHLAEDFAQPIFLCPVCLRDVCTWADSQLFYIQG